MHSVVIHLKKKPQDWHLVESLFYKVQASKQLMFLQLEDHRNWGEVAKQVQDYILQNRFENWQLILLNNLELNEESLNSLTREVSLIKVNLLQPLKERGIAPIRKILLTLDGYKRNADYSPILKKNHYHWQMDNFGYIVKGDAEEHCYGNVFLEEEIQALDEAWGTLVNLKEAGIMEDPSETFLTELNERVSKVQSVLHLLLYKKRSMLNENAIVNAELFFELHTNEMLDGIASEFENQLIEICTPPFSYHLSTFLPSMLLKTILKDSIGAPSVMDDFLIIRKAINELSPFRRVRALIGYALLLNALILKPEVTDRLGNGIPFEVEVLLRDEELKEMYINYYVCLQVAKEKIENRNLEQSHFLTNKYADILTLPYTTEPLAEMEMDIPVFYFKQRRTFLQDWNAYLKDFECALETREAISLDSAKAGAQVFTVTKRQKNDHLLQETVNLAEYTKSLKALKNHIQTELQETSHSLYSSRLKWIKHCHEFKNRMALLVRSLPSSNIILVTSIVVLLCFFIPYTANTVQPHWPTYILIAGMFLLLISVLAVIVYQRLLKPIKHLTIETLSLQKSLADEQMISHSKYNDYLNNIYKLFRVRNQMRELDKRTEYQRELNVLYRYHYGEIKNHIAILSLLIDSLGISIHLENKSKCVSFFHSVFNVEKNVYSNAIYSPLECQFNHARKSGHSMDVYVENSRDEITTWSLNPIEKIRFSQDKVYTL
jgi:hypothetical protein